LEVVAGVRGDCEPARRGPIKAAAICRRLSSCLGTMRRRASM